ncbi:GFA family protein [Sphingosinicella terrae]|uniref:GFA family protein n=1 Tax=Sphingosinicella terrae TaxID=2172047 RepID=UPI003D7DF3E9
MVYLDEAVQAIEGEARRWRRIGDAGRWVEQHFCPTCGGLLYMTAEAMPGAIAVSAGCFVDRERPPPAAVHNLHGAPPWLLLSDFVPPA